jgi:polyhydroxybutyrate depolymerase
VPLLAIHGDADRNHPLEGGSGARSVAGVEFASTADSLARWAEAMACSPDPARSVAGALTTLTWSGCRDGVRTELVVIAGADHPWPGAPERRASALQGEPTKELDATSAVWGFFKALSSSG